MKTFLVPSAIALGAVIGIAGLLGYLNLSQEFERARADEKAEADQIAHDNAIIASFPRSNMPTSHRIILGEGPRDRAEKYMPFANLAMLAGLVLFCGGLLLLIARRFGKQPVDQGAGT